jgi:hypothetical protein
MKPGYTLLVGTELERHPPERGALPVVVAGGCCTTCCCCCCCCAYVVGGLAGAAVGAALARDEGAGAKAAIADYWARIGWTFLAALALGAAGFAFPGFWLPAAALALFGLPVAQALGSLVMFVNQDPAARRAAVKVTVAWFAFTVIGAWLTAVLFKSCK